MSHESLPYVFVRILKIRSAWCAIVRGNQRQFKPDRTSAAYDFRMKWPTAGSISWTSAFAKKARARCEPAP